MANTSDILAAANSLSASIQGFASAQDSTKARAWATKQNEYLQKFNAEQAQIARDWSEKMWNKQNAYDTPAAQMARAAAAGINPYAAFSSLGSLSGSDSMPSSSAATAPNGVDYSSFTPTKDFAQVSGSGINTALGILQLSKNANTLPFDIGQSQQDYMTKSLSNMLLNGDVSLLPNKIEASKFLFNRQIAESNAAILESNFKALNMNEICSNTLKQIIGASALQDAQLKAFGLDNQAKEISNKYLPETIETALSNMKKQGLLTDEQIKVAEMTWRTGYAMCQANIIHLQHENNMLDSSADLNRANTRYTNLQGVGQALQNQLTRNTMKYRQGPSNAQERRHYYRNHGNAAQKAWGSALDILDDLTGVLGPALGGSASSVINKVK